MATRDSRITFRVPHGLHLLTPAFLTPAHFTPGALGLAHPRTPI